MVARPASRKWELGDSGWEVEWCSKLAFDEAGDMDMDGCTYEVRDFREREDAMAFARKVFGKDQFGSVRITPFTLEPLSDTWPYGCHREYTGDSEFYDGE